MKSLFEFQFGPVQDFIAAAREMSDFFNGSFLLSKMSLAAALAVKNIQGTEIVFPYIKEESVDDLKQPSVPNRFLALVPAGTEEVCANAAEEALRDELKKHAKEVIEPSKGREPLENRLRRYIKNEDVIGELKKRFYKQLELLPEITWSSYPLAEDDEYENEVKVCARLMAARRNTRDFVSWNTDSFQTSARKDVLTGKEEEIVKGKCAMTLVKEAMEALPGEKSLKKIAECNDGKNPYIAIIMLDGDRMGKWMSGAKEGGVTYRLKEYEQNLKDHQKEFSKRLGEFSASIKNIVEEGENNPFGNSVKGQLVYAGGDDVLAVVPATKAFACADEIQKLFKEKIAHECATVSCGIVVAHHKFPLRRIIEEAHRAESRAKNVYGRNAFAFSLLKRSGEILEWGGKWTVENNVSAITGETDKSSPAKKLYEGYVKITTEDGDKVSSRFPYVLAALLSPYALEKGVSEDGLDLPALVKKEFCAVCSRQIETANVREKMEKLPVQEYCEDLKKSDNLGDFIKLFLTAAFIHRPRGDED